MTEKEIIYENRLRYAQNAWQDANECLRDAMRASKCGNISAYLAYIQAAEYSRQAACLALRSIGLTPEQAGLKMPEGI